MTDICSRALRAADSRAQPPTSLTFQLHFVMGKTKLYSETETTAASAGYHSSTGSGAAARGRKPSYSPGRFAPDNPDALPTPVLIRQIKIRLRRTWVAFRFRANRLSFGLLERKKALQFGGLAVASYVLFFTNWIISPSTAAANYGGEGVDTALEVGADSKPKGSKSVNWGTKNDAAPVSPKYLTDEMTNDYVGRFSKIAVAEMEKYGVPASISLAQGLIESRAGTSKLAVSNNNHFGIKCFSRRCKKGHCSNFTDDTHKDFFRKFAAPWDSWREHSRMISTGRYARLKKHGRDFRGWATGLKQLGYATDAKYDIKLIGMIEKHELWKYDR
jgi:hypothetical protein